MTFSLARFDSVVSRVRFLRTVHLLGAVLAVGSTVLTGCSEKIEEVETPVGGSCLACHTGITDVHPYFALACVDCHGGNDKVEIKDAVVNIRDQALLKASHVLPKDPEQWWPNGIDDNGDGRVDEQGEFFDGRVVDQDGNAGLADGRLAKRDQQDSEQNKDMNYLRFINPGDLRVAEVSCGGRNKNANAAMVCHAEVVYDVRRSIMAVQAGVPAGALYGNAQLPVAEDYGANFANSDQGVRFNQRNPRIGRAAYAFDYDSVDGAYDPVSNTFNRDELLAIAKQNLDPNDDLFEIQAGPVSDDGTATDPFGNALDPGRGFTRTGNKLAFFDANDETNNRSIEVLQNIGDSAFRTFPVQGSTLELRVQRILEGVGIPRQSPIRNVIPNDGSPITNPADAALRVFRAYHTLNTFGANDNFGFVDFFTSPNEDDPPPNDPTDVELRNNNNPFGRFRTSGCSACHVEVAGNGHNEEPIDRTVADNGRQAETALPFGVRQDLGQRGYARRHEIKKAVQIETCASCHGFVTRIDFALEAKFELETDFTNLEKVQTIGPFTFATPGNKTACVNVFDNLAHYKNGNIINEGEGQTEDLNGNGELDQGEDLNNNGCLDIPDRVARSESFDGRQSKLIYGGANGSTRLKDVHIEVGMACSDCHLTSAHGDSNVYTRNWDAEPMECEDCHGTPYEKTNLKSSGPNGNDDFTAAIWDTPFGKPWFEEKDGKIIQNSRTRADLSWEVSQLVDEADGDVKTAYAKYAHEQPFESGPDPGREDEGRGFAHIQEAGKKGGLECYSCHSSWQPNCLTCHLKMDVAKPKQEIWWGDDDVEDVFFQLFSYTRSPFYMGRGADVEGNKISPFRSTMQVHLTIAAGGLTVVDNAMFSTKEGFSSMVSNQYFPHTVRVNETKSCARCHTLELEVNGKEVIANDHFITEATGQGSGRYMNVGDWALVATTAGFQQIDLKKEVGGLTFPGFDFDDKNPRRVDFLNGNTHDIALLRGVSFENGSSDIADVAIVAHDGGVSMVDVFGRDNAGLPPTEIARIDSLGPVLSVDVVDTAASQSKRFAALSDEELCTLDFVAALENDTVAPIIDADAGSEGDDAGVLDSGVDGFAQGTNIVGCVPHGKDSPTRVRLHGRFALVAHARGITLYALDDADLNTAIDLGAPLAEVATFETARPALDVTTSGRFAYVATGEGGVEIFDIGPAVYPLFVQDTFEPQVLDTAPVGVALTNLEQEADSRGLTLHGSRLLVADGKNGLRILDVAVPADPRLEDTIQVVPGQLPIDQATSVVIATVPTRTFALVADGAHGLRAVNITPAQDFRLQLAAATDDPDAFRGFRLSQERSDPLTPFDPKNTSRQVLTYPTTGGAVQLAKGLSFDNIADKSGRQLRDAWALGSSTLDERTVARMRSVIVKEVPGTVDIRGDGLGCIVREGDENDVPRDPEDPNRCLPVQSRGGE